MADVFKVTKSWRQSYSPALSVTEGEGVDLGKRDEDWPGWVWCRNRDGIGGWLPEELLSFGVSGKTATLLRAFNTVELTIDAGERLRGFERRSGWIWCRNGTGEEGWVPCDCLAES